MSAKTGANYYATRQHIGQPDTWSAYQRGQKAWALCSNDSNPVEIYDQAVADNWRKQFPESKPVDVAALPLCKRCERKAAK